MNIEDLKKFLENHNINDIEIEDYEGNTIGFLKDFDIADIENNALRIQLNRR